MKLTKMKKEDLELLSYPKIAELYIRETKEKLNTADLFKKVCDILELSDNEYTEKIADFFEALTTSKDFILLKDGKWDLKQNHSIKVDIEEIYSEKEEGIEEILTDENKDNSSDYDNEMNEDNYDDEEQEEDYDEELSELTIIDEDDILDE